MYNCFTCAVALGKPAKMMSRRPASLVTPWWRARLTPNLCILIFSYVPHGSVLVRDDLTYKIG